MPRCFFVKGLTRFIKFGLVGASGVAVNLAVLYLGEEWLFANIDPAPVRLNLALALAIGCATVNNFCWNRRWTWRDRCAQQARSLIGQFGQYALGSWSAILLQFIVTQALVAVSMHYLVANLVAIIVASVLNFLLHHFWTFK